MTITGVDPFELTNRNSALRVTNYGSGSVTDMIGFGGIEDTGLPACTAPFSEIVGMYFLQ